MKRAEQLAKTRKAILRTATKLFLENGFNGTSTRDIAKHIGITQPALYHHFSDKEVLYLDVLTALCGKVRQDINKVMRKEDMDPEERLWEIAKVILKYHAYGQLPIEVGHDLYDGLRGTPVGILQAARGQLTSRPVAKRSGRTLYCQLDATVWNLPTGRWSGHQRRTTATNHLELHSARLC